MMYLKKPSLPLPIAVILGTLAVVTLGYVVACAAPPAAQHNVAARELAAARRSLEAAQIELRLYEKVDYPLQRRRLQSKIKLIEAELESHQRHITEYEQFTKFTHSAPFFHTLAEVRLAKLDAELLLEDTQEEKDLCERFHPDRCRLYELRVEAAQQRVAAFEPVGRP